MRNDVLADNCDPADIGISHLISCDALSSLGRHDEAAEHAQHACDMVRPDRSGSPYLLRVRRFDPHERELAASAFFALGTEHLALGNLAAPLG